MLLVVALSFYVLEGVLINPFIIWAVLPIYIGMGMYSSASKNNELSRLPAIHGFLMLSLAASYAYHLAWFFDIAGMKTSSSTSALIFIFFPIYCVIIGYVGWGAGCIYSWMKNK